jgi:hypothetical protein
MSSDKYKYYEYEYESNINDKDGEPTKYYLYEVDGLIKYCYKLDNTHFCYNFNYNRWYIDHNMLNKINNGIKNKSINKSDIAIPAYGNPREIIEEINLDWQGPPDFGAVGSQLKQIQKNNFPEYVQFLKRETPAHTNYGKWSEPNGYI